MAKRNLTSKGILSLSLCKKLLLMAVGYTKRSLTIQAQKEKTQFSIAVNAWDHLPRFAIWKIIWEFTLERNPIYATYVGRISSKKVNWQSTRRFTNQVMKTRVKESDCKMRDREDSHKIHLMNKTRKTFPAVTVLWRC